MAHKTSSVASLKGLLKDQLSDKAKSTKPLEKSKISKPRFGKLRQRFLKSA